MKGQTVEYLMTYGWALIILIVAGVLAYYGIFTPEDFLNQRCFNCCNCYNETKSCYISGCTCNDTTSSIESTFICDYQEPHYIIPY